MSYRDNIPPLLVMKAWHQINFSGELRVVGTVLNRFRGQGMMTSPVIGMNKQPIRVSGSNPDFLDDDMIIQTLSGSRYLLREKDDSHNPQH